jgi:hypothetical protein
MRNFEELFAALGKSDFRSRFALGEQERRYLGEKGLPAIIDHARDFIQLRLAPANPPNDGRQTPMRGHPVFIAQHATATCCRSCLAKWHHLKAGTVLREEEVNYVVDVLQRWLAIQTQNLQPNSVTPIAMQTSLEQKSLF